MFDTVQGLRLYVHRSGAGAPVVLLHGWGTSGGSFQGVCAALAGRHECLAPDLPGFGRSDPPPSAWSSLEYAALLREWLRERGLVRPALIGHSFGGKVALRLAAEGLASRVILFGSAGIPPRRPPAYYAKVYTFKTLKLLARLPGFRPLFGDVAERMRRRTGSADYRAASGIMRDSLVRSVNEDIRPVLPRVACPTLLIWGRNDTATPVSDGETMKSLLPDAGLVVVENAGHYVFNDQPDRVFPALRAFLGDTPAEAASP